MMFKNFHWLDLTKYAARLLRQIAGGINIDLFHNIPTLALNFKLSLNSPYILSLEIYLRCIKLALIAIREESV